MSESLMSMLQNAKRRDNALVLMVLDLDHFKDINDPYGYACLCIFSSRLKTKFGNDGEHAARPGGEEFGVLCKALHRMLP